MFARPPQIAVDGTMSVAQAYVDEDEEETFYATAWTHSVRCAALVALSGVPHARPLFEAWLGSF